MKRKLTNEGVTAVRRKDRAITDDASIKQFLRQAAYGFIAAESGGQPFQHTSTFVYDEDTNSIYLHTARSGRFRTNIEGNEKVCFTVSHMGRLLPAPTAREFSVEYESVVAFGRAFVMTDMELARAKMQLLIHKYFPHLKSGSDYRAITDDEIRGIAVYRIEIDAWSGKRKLASPDFPGAFLYGER